MKEMGQLYNIIDVVLKKINSPVPHEAYWAKVTLLAMTTTIVIFATAAINQPPEVIESWKQSAKVVTKAVKTKGGH